MNKLATNTHIHTHAYQLLSACMLYDFDMTFACMLTNDLTVLMIFENGGANKNTKPNARTYTIEMNAHLQLMLVSTSI